MVARYAMICTIFALIVNQLMAFNVACGQNVGNKTLYFGYGSNLLASRMNFMNPTAVRAGIGKLKDYQLDFASYSRIWQGYAASIIPKYGSVVWGALWEIPTEDIYKLDRQEAVHANLYYPITVDVETPEGKILQARCYRQVDDVRHVSFENQTERKPTPAYLNTIIHGAEESHLPLEYIDYLKKIPHNGSPFQPNLAYIYPKSQ